MTRISPPLFMALAVSAAAADTAPAEAPRPRIVVTGETLDLGAVPQGEIAEGSFEIRNEGEATLAILRAKPS